MEIYGIDSEDLIKLALCRPFQLHGEHRLTITVTNTDRYGVELDKVIISFRQCEGPCPSVISSTQSSIYENCNSVTNFESESGLVSSSSLDLCNLVSSQTPCTQQRSEASNQRTVYFSRDGQNVSLRLSTPSWCTYRITNVQYSNDGPPDTITIYMDNAYIGQFITIGSSGAGHLWNVFKQSGVVGREQLISPGDHWLTLSVSLTDEDGVELDEATVMFTMCAGDCPVSQPVHQVDQPMSNENCNTSFTLEMENAISSAPLKLCNDVNLQTPCIQFRSEASNEQTLHLSSNGQYASFNISSFSRCFFHIIGLFYSNDGDQDKISFFLDNDRFGEVTTHAKSGGGHLWNVIENSGLVGNTQTLVPGEHTLTIRASNTDEHGVELDALKISLRCVKANAQS